MNEEGCPCGIIGGCDYHRLQSEIRAHDATRAALSEARAVLRIVEWSGPGDREGVKPWEPSRRTCPLCGAVKPDHAPDCRLAAVSRGEGAGEEGR
jgi:hypothetical protein